MRRSTQPVGEERRDLSLAVARPEVRADDSGAKRFDGHAAVFNERTAIGNPLTWGFYEQVADGAFTKTIGEGDARFLIDHDSYYVVARKSAETLDLTQDKIGLSVDAALDTRLSYVNDLVFNLENKNITGMSFGFYVVKDDWDVEDVETSDGQTAEVEVRTIREVKLLEVSAVTFPAYEGTDAGLRSAVLALRSRGDVDAIARRAGFRPEMATLLDEVEPRKLTVVNNFVAPVEAVREDAPTEETTEQVAEPVEDSETKSAADEATTAETTPADEREDAPAEDITETDDERGAGEPGETTRTPDSPTDDLEGSEPAETTRTSHRPSEAAIRKARMTALAAQLGLPAAA